MSVISNLARNLLNADERELFIPARYWTEALIIRAQPHSGQYCFWQSEHRRLSSNLPLSPEARAKLVAMVLTGVT